MTKQRIIFDVIDRIMSSEAIEEYQSHLHDLSELCDDLYEEHDTKTNYQTDYYSILEYVDGIDKEYVDELYNRLDKLEFNLWFQKYLSESPNSLSSLFEDCEKKYKDIISLNTRSLSLLKEWFESSSRQVQMWMAKLFQRYHRLDLILYLKISYSNISRETSELSYGG